MKRLILFLSCIYLVIDICAESEMRANLSAGGGVNALKSVVYDAGGIVRGDTSQKELTLIFTAAGQADGASSILRTLDKQHVKGAFFFTSGFFRKFPDVIKAIQKDGHYLGGHSDKHPLYCDWGKRDSTLITKEDFITDIMANYKVLAEAGIEYEKAPFFIPPYEWYNKEVAGWAKSLGIQIVNFTPGSGSNADYTTPDMKNYKSSQEIYERIMEYEAKNGLNGHLLLVHLGTHPNRTDKFYNRLDELIRALKRKGYKFVPLEELIAFFNDDI